MQRFFCPKSDKRTSLQEKMGDSQLIKRILAHEFPDESKPTHKDLISDKFFEKVDESGVDFEKLLKTSENDVGRVYLFKKYFDWLPVCQDELNRKFLKASSCQYSVGIKM